MPRLSIALAEDESQVDRAVGRRLKERRLQLGLSQQAVATSVGVSYQQIQKYEKGISRLSASGLVRLAKVLDTPMSYFLSDATAAEAPPAERTDGQATRDGLELLRAFSRISDHDVRRRLIDLAKTLADKA